MSTLPRPRVAQPVSQVVLQPHANLRLRLGVAVFALFARLFILWFSITRSSAGWIYGRGLEMGYVAKSLLTGHGFASPFGAQTGPTALIAPGYPLLVAGIFHIFGIYSATSAVVIMLLQTAAGVLTVWLIMHLAGKLAGERAALIAGLFWACWLPLLWIPTIFWETSFSICMLVALLTLALHIRKQPSRKAWVGLGLFCGVAVLVNMALLITSVAVWAWLAFHTWRMSRTNIVLAACVFLLIYSPWPVRNARVFHAFVPLRTTVGLELWMGNYNNAPGYLEESLFPVYNRQQLDLYVREGEIAFDKEKSATAKAWIATHPRAFIKLSLKRFFRYWTGTGSRNGSPIYGFGATLTTLGGFCGLLLLYRSGRRNVALLFALPLIFLPLPYYITHAEFRYRLVVDPLLTILSAYAAVQLSSFKHREESK